jgi:O-methyltransferase involved in polyketide biosynthesis
MTENPNVVYVVSDLPEILQQEKTIAETILSRSNGRRPNLHFETANALDRENLSRASAIFRSDQPIAVITEGLFPYLNRSEEEVLALNIHALLERYSGVWIVSDVHTKQIAEEASQIDENRLQRRSIISNSTQRNLEDNVFVDHNDIEQFFNKAGFNMEEYAHSNVVEDLSSTRIMNLTQKEMVKIQQVLRMLKTLILIPQKM